MALVFHDGFETGGADAWLSVTGSPTFVAGAARTGGYGMRCNTSAAQAFITSTSTGSVNVSKWSFNLYITSLPNSDCTILIGQRSYIEIKRPF